MRPWGERSAADCDEILRASPRQFSPIVFLFRAALAKRGAGGCNGKTEAGDDEDDRDHDPSAAPGEDGNDDVGDRRQRAIAPGSEPPFYSSMDRWLLSRGNWKLFRLGSISKCILPWLDRRESSVKKRL